MKLLPVALNVQNKRCLVVGGGAVAARKVAALLECDAIVTIVAPQCSAALQTHLAHCKYFERTFEPDDCAAQQLVFACTDNEKVNAQIAQAAREHGSWCHRADDATQSDFHSAAVVRQGEICVGITTGGHSPGLARHLKEVIAADLQEYQILLELIAARRAVLKQSVASQSERAELLHAVFESNVLELLNNGQLAEAEQLIDTLLSTP